MLNLDSYTIRVAIVDDHELVRTGIKTILALARDIVVVGEGATGVQALELAKTHNPDIVLLDVEMPVMKGDEAARRISEAELRARVVAVSSYNDPVYRKAMLDNGAVAYLTKDEVPRNLIETIRAVALQESNWASQHFKDYYPSEADFSGREVSILEQLASNRSSVEIAHSLGLNPKFIEQHIELLKKKLSVDKLLDLRRLAGQLEFARNHK